MNATVESEPKITDEGVVTTPNGVFQATLPLEIQR